jgi:pimeloyl-ACP methyl ester carboxylesterase
MQTLAKALLVLALALPACDGSVRAPEPQSQRAPERPSAEPRTPAARPSSPLEAAPPPPPSPPSTPALAAEGPLVEIPVPGFGSAIVSLPLGATKRRPVLVAAHGNYDRPEWQCMVWREIVGDSAFILCPRGVARPDSPSRDDVRFTYDSNAALEREIDAGLAALAALFPEHVDPGPVVHAGFSLGAIQGVPIATRTPAKRPRLVLVEGGHDKWTAEAAAAFAKGGGARVLFVCAQKWCTNDAKRAAARLERAGVMTRVVHSAEVGHRYDGPVAEEARKALPWVLEGDARW